MISSALIVGSGLVGTSAGMALSRAGIEVLFTDRDERASALASQLSGGAVWRGEAVDISIVAVPIPALAQVICEQIQMNLARTVIDLGSVKVKPVLEVQTLLVNSSQLLERYCPTHPMAGRERSGPDGARSDLFQGRPWVLTPTRQTSETAQRDAREVIETCGGVPLVMAADVHDQSVALVSHLPQIVASTIAGLLAEGAGTPLELAGAGLRDLTRIAGSDPELWAGILTGNANEISRFLDLTINRLIDIRTSLDGGDALGIYRHIALGNLGRARIPGKHGGLSTNYVVVPVVVDDRPGQLASLFTAAGECEVNIEDLSMEHSPGQPLGLVELSVDPAVSDLFIAFLRERGWRVHPPRTSLDKTTE
jgi:prephenate dehydrogenase